LLLSFLIINPSVYSEEININKPFGFNFGMSSKNAKKLINSNNKEILKNEVDSKDIRTILFDGIIVEYPSIIETDKKTRLEFYKDKLMSALIVLKNLSSNQFTDIQNEFITDIETEFGEANSKDNMLSFDIWKWNIDEIKLILSTNRNKGEVKLEYTYIPIAESKVDNELEVKRKGKLKNPADQMFKDGNFSQQGAPVNKY
ncbi:MAG: hypothetical protein ACR2NW_09700, partial [Thermodesulfobacteriota bacterium]